MASCDSHVEGCCILSITCIDKGSSFEQELHNLRVTMSAGKVKGCLALDVCGSYTGLVLDESLSSFGVAIVGCYVQSCVLAGFIFVEVRMDCRLQEDIKIFNVTSFCSCIQVLTCNTTYIMFIITTIYSTAYLMLIITKYVLYRLY